MKKQEDRKLNRIEELLLFILDRAQKIGKKNLSNFELFKLPYLLEVFSLRYTGSKLIPDLTFQRDKNGPISKDIYEAKTNLEGKYIETKVIENPEYGHPRYANTLIRKIPKLNFNLGETIFLDNFLADLLPLSQKELKRLAYKTEPMKGEVKKGTIINFTKVVIDPDVIDTYSDV